MQLAEPRRLLHPCTSSGSIPRSQAERGHGPIIVQVRQEGVFSSIDSLIRNRDRRLIRWATDKKNTFTEVSVGVCDLNLVREGRLNARFIQRSNTQFYGYVVHEKRPFPLGPPQDLKHGPTVGS